MSDYAFPADLLPTLLGLSLTAVNLIRPLYGPDGTTIADFHLDYLNPAAQRMTGLPEQPGLTALTRFPNLATNGVFDFYCHTYQHGGADTFELNYQVDGLDNYFRLAAQRCGQVLVVSFTDTGDQTRTPVENALRAAQAAEQQARAEAELQRQRFYDLLMQLPAHVAVHEGPDQVFTLVNPYYQRMAGGRNLLGQPIREAWPELVSHGILDTLNRVYQTGEPFIANEVPVQADFTRTGQLEQVYYNFFFLALRDAQGRINGVLNFSYDVSASVRARQQVEQLNQELETRVQERTRQLNEQQALLRQILGNVPATIATVSGPEHRYTFFNERYQEQVGYRAELALPLAEALPGVVELDYVAMLDRVYATGQLFEGREVPFTYHVPTAGGQPVHYIDFLCQPLLNAQGHTTGILVFANDVTERVLARQRVQDLNEELAVINEELTATNEELHDSNTQLTRTNVDLDTFVYTASHDLKAPITNIESIALALRDTLPTPVQQDELVAHLLGLLDTTVARFQFTIAQLTDVSRLQLAHNGPAEPVVLAAVVDDVRLDLASAIGAAGTQLTVEVAPELVLSFSPANLRSIVYNLLSNAVKYRAAGRSSLVQVRAQPMGSTIVLTVQDNGLGLSELQQRQLFGLFQRLHTHVEGTGVGLYITKRLVENAGGTITVQSQPEVGTTFTVTLPA